MKKMDNVSWSEVYNQIADLLNEYYKSSLSNSGLDLYYLLKSNKKFVINNQWIESIGSGMEEYSVDPLHIFASLSERKIGVERRVKRINQIIEILSRSESIGLYSILDLDECPESTVEMLTTPREFNEQKLLWNVFHEAFEGGKNSLDYNLFSSSKSIYGVRNSHLSIFLYWIRPDSFLPMDKYTLDFLREKEVIKNWPKSFSEYERLLSSNYRDVYKLTYSLAHGYKNEFDLKDTEKEIYKHFFSNLNKRIKRKAIANKVSA